MPNASLKAVLIVDDSAVQRIHVHGLLRQLGIDAIHEAANGIQALELLARLDSAPDLIIVDLEMPDMDGVEFIQHMALRHVRAPLVIASSRDMTVINTVESMTQELGWPVLAAWQKPITAVQLAEVLGRRPAVPDPVSLASKERSKKCPVPAHELATAIAGHQVQPHYQPKIDLQTGLIKGVEVLARWRHAERGFIPPDQFIPLAESHGLIHQLTLNLANQAFAQVAEWARHGLSLTVAINLSPQLLDSPDFVAEVGRLLRHSYLPAEQIVWEITEGSLAADLGMALGNLARLRLKGCGLSIDDYGTGFSSMQQLSRIPFTELKIDRSFVHGAHQREHLRVILQSALDMAHKMRLVTVAEGIETVEEWRLLREFGCNLAQGYFVAKPVPGDTLPDLVKEAEGRMNSLCA